VLHEKVKRSALAGTGTKVVEMNHFLVVGFNPLEKYESNWTISVWFG